MALALPGPTAAHGRCDGHPQGLIETDGYKPLRNVSKTYYQTEMAPPHPGEILREDVLPSLGMTRAELATHLGISLRVLQDVLAERRPVTLDLALRFGAALGYGPRYWLGLQIQHDIWTAERAGTSAVKPIEWSHRPSPRNGRTPPNSFRTILSVSKD